MRESRTMETAEPSNPIPPRNPASTSENPPCRIKCSINSGRIPLESAPQVPSTTALIAANSPREVMFFFAGSLCGR